MSGVLCTLSQVECHISTPPLTLCLAVHALSGHPTSSGFSKRSSYLTTAVPDPSEPPPSLPSLEQG
eukprot:10866740-Karenia_brevis.AAC.1